MAFVPLTNVIPQLLDDNGNLLSGGTLKFFDAGTTTPTTVYSDNVGTPLGTEVTLDADGHPKTAGGAKTLIWLETGQNYKIEAVDASDVTIWGPFDDIPPFATSGSADTDDEWIEETSVTYASSTSFVVTGTPEDNFGNALWHVGRRVAVSGTNTGNVFGTISSVSVGTDTTVTLITITDSAGATATLSNESLTAWVGLISAKVPTSLPQIFWGGVFPEMFGAAGDGTTDDFTALEAAEQYAFDNGLILHGYPGSSYAFNGRFGSRVSIHGNGCTFKPLSTVQTETVSNWNSGGTKATGIIFKDFTVDSGLNTRGMYLLEADDCRIENVTAKNCISGGISCYLSDRIQVIGCYINDVQYKTVGGTGQPADGVYFGGCVRGQAINCQIQNFRRIGIVSEEEGVVKSEDTRAIGNQIFNANNSDDSTTEYNAAIWFENTNGGDISYNYAWDLAGNSGQTNNRVRGMVIVATGTDADSVLTCVGNKVDGEQYTLQGSSAKVAVYMEGNESRNSESLTSMNLGISVAAGLKSLTIRDHTFDGLRVGTSGLDALVRMDFSSAKDPIKIILDNLHYSNLSDAGSSSDWSHINIFSGGPTEMHLLNLSDMGVVDRGDNSKTDLIVVSNSRIQVGSASNYTCLNAAKILVSNSTIEQFGSRSGKLFDAASADSQIVVSNSVFDGITFDWSGSSYVEAQFNNCMFLNGSNMDLNMSGGWTVKFEGCYIDEYKSANGFLYTNFNNSSPNDRLFVRGCDFTRSTDVTPIQVRTNQPTVTVLHGNTTTATALHDFTSPTQDTDNSTGVAV